MQAVRATTSSLSGQNIPVADWIGRGLEHTCGKRAHLRESDGSILPFPSLISMDTPKKNADTRISTPKVGDQRIYNQDVQLAAMRSLGLSFFSHQILRIYQSSFPDRQLRTDLVHRSSLLSQSHGRSSQAAIDHDGK